MVSPLQAQHLLDRSISFQSDGKPLTTVLAALSNQGGFYFSYNSNILPADSNVSLDVHQQSIRIILDMLLGENYEYKETGNYIIIRRKSYNGHAYTISGHIINSTGDPISKATVYERTQLASALSDSSGFFRLRLRTHSPRTLITISKSGYNDTSFTISAGYDQVLTVPISPIRFITLDSVTISQYSQIEKTWIGRFFISSKQKVESLNLSDFLAKKPFQYSIVPGIGTHGKLSAQVVNKFSMNILGGYSAGVNGFELGGLFNIDKKDVRHVQIAGLFNSVGGKINGLQIAGLHNGVLDSVKGFQIAGLTNHVSGDISGLMLAGISNINLGNMRGVQAAGIFNSTRHTTGLQLAGIGNISKTSVDGIQLSAIFNYTPNLKGWQIGLVNIADTSSGRSIGIINITRHGYRKVSLSYNEVFDLNIALKTGNKKLYGILLAGVNPAKNKKAYSLGFGMGEDFTLAKSMSFITDLTGQTIYTGRWGNLPFLIRLQPALQVTLNRKTALFIGPAFSGLFASPNYAARDYDKILPAKHYLSVGNKFSAWFGGQVGITFF